ncbi:MAG: Uncharacterized membrane protein, YraQ family, partial [uncultured Chloroflexia bacterium]
AYCPRLRHPVKPAAPRARAARMAVGRARPAAALDRRWPRASRHARAAHAARSRPGHHLSRHLYRGPTLRAGGRARILGDRDLCLRQRDPAARAKGTLWRGIRRIGARTALSSVRVRHCAHYPPPPAQRRAAALRRGLPAGRAGRQPGCDRLDLCRVQRRLADGRQPGRAHDPDRRHRGAGVELASAPEHTAGALTRAQHEWLWLRAREPRPLAHRRAEPQRGRADRDEPLADPGCTAGRHAADICATVGAAQHRRRAGHFGGAANGARDAPVGLLDRRRLPGAGAEQHLWTGRATGVPGLRPDDRHQERHDVPDDAFAAGRDDHRRAGDSAGAHGRCARQSCVEI